MLKRHALALAHTTSKQAKEEEGDQGEESAQQCVEG
jgi:hypothetical protein